MWQLCPHICFAPVKLIAFLDFLLMSSHCFSNSVLIFSPRLIFFFRDPPVNLYALASDRKVERVSGWINPRHVLRCQGHQRGLQLHSGFRPDLSFLFCLTLQAGSPLEEGFQTCTQVLIHSPPLLDFFEFSTFRAISVLSGILLFEHFY